MLMLHCPHACVGASNQLLGLHQNYAPTPTKTSTTTSLPLTQEVTHFEDLQAGLAPAGYKGLYMRRAGRRRDGSAIFYKTSRLALLQQHNLDYSQIGLEDSVALIVHLQPLAEPPAASAARDAAHGNDSPDAGGSSSVAADGPTAAAARSTGADGLGTALASSSAAANSSYAAGGSGDNVEAAHVCDAAAGSCASCSGAPTANSGAAADAYSDASTASAGSAAAACSCRLVVATTHICFDPNKGDVKLGQVRELISRVHDQLRRTPGSVAIIAGDFNMVPCCPLYEFITGGCINLADHARKRLSGQVIDLTMVLCQPCNPLFPAHQGYLWCPC